MKLLQISTSVLICILISTVHISTNELQQMPILDNPALLQPI